MPSEWGLGAREELAAIVQRAEAGLPALPPERFEELRALIEARLHARDSRSIEVPDVEESARIVVPAWRANVRAGSRGRSPLVAATWTFVVVLPILVIVLESVGHPCRELLGIDLVRTPLHVALLAAVPLVGALASRWIREPIRASASPLRGAAVGVALTVAVVHGLTFLALSPISLFLALAAGFGLLGLVPVLCAVTFLLLAWRLARRGPHGEGRFPQGLVLGVVACVATYALLDPRLLIHAMTLGTSLLGRTHVS